MKVILIGSGTIIMASLAVIEAIEKAIQEEAKAMIVVDKTPLVTSDRSIIDEEEYEKMKYYLDYSRLDDITDEDESDIANPVVKSVLSRQGHSAFVTHSYPTGFT